MIEVDVLDVSQPGLSMYVGKMRARDLIQVTDVRRCLEELGVEKGYQREVDKVRLTEIAEYISKSEIVAFPSSVVLSLRGDGVEVVEENGMRKVRIMDNAKLFVIDGQHRIWGFEKFGVLLQKGQYEGKENLLNIELPVTFVDLREMDESEAIAVERSIFLIMNETQKRVPANLRTILLYLMEVSNKIRHPILEKNRLRIEGAYIARRLHSEEDSPLYQKVKVTDERGLKRLINVNTLARAIEVGFGENSEFKKADKEEKYGFVKNFFAALRDMFPSAFEDEKQSDWILLKSAVVYALMYLASDVYSKLKAEGKDLSVENISEMIEPLMDIDFSKDSPLNLHGGYQGVRVIYCNYLRRVLERRNILSEEERPEWCGKVEKYRKKLEKMLEAVR